MLIEYRNYFESLLSIPIEQIEQASGILITATQDRDLTPEGWVTRLPICAFETDTAIIISCSPGLKSRLNAVLSTSAVPNAIPNIREFINSEKSLHMAHIYYRIFGLDEESAIYDVTDVVLLSSLHSSETIPNKPYKIIELGVNTRVEHRRKGYATAVCSAFIRHHLQQGIKPMWSCAFDNIESETLAMKLGFKYMGNIFYTAALGC